MEHHQNLQKSFKSVSMTDDESAKTWKKTSSVLITPLHRDTISNMPNSKVEMSIETLTLKSPMTKKKTSKVRESNVRKSTLSRQT